MVANILTPEGISLDSPLWQFAGKFWSAPEAQRCCLSLQDNGWSVTRILCALWLASTGNRYSGEEAESVLQWRIQVTEALRGARKSIQKNNVATETVRNSIARSELEAEKVELALAYQALATQSGSAQTKASDLASLALGNLHAAAPDTAMDNDTSSLLDTLTRQLLRLVAEEAEPCS